MVKFRKILAVTSFLIAGTLSGFAQNIIQNGSFESPVISPTNIFGIGLTPGVALFIPSSSPPITNWPVASGTVSLVDAGGSLTSLLGLFTADTGSQYVVLNGLTTSALGLGRTGTTGSIQQSFSTTAGDTYQLTFATRGLAVGLLNGAPQLSVAVSGNTLTGPGSGLLTLDLTLNSWTTETYSFVATGGTSTLTFSQPNGSVGNIGLVGLDSVNLIDQTTPVPEPSQYMDATFGFLFLLVGGRVLRRRCGASRSLQAFVPV